MYSDGDRLFKKAIEEEKLAGAVWAVWKEGKLQHQASFGMADRERNIPMKNNNIFRLYSTTKPITSVAVMMLLEKGLLDLLDPLRDYLPEFSHLMVYEEGEYRPAERDILLRDLMNMTSGIVYPGEDVPGKAMNKQYQSGINRAKEGRPFSTQEFVRTLAQAPLAFEPGTGWRYGSNAEILAAVVEIVSGQPFGDFLKEHIFDALEMRDTAFFVPEEKMDRLAQVYEYHPDKPHLVPYTGDNLMIWAKSEDPAFQSGGAGLFSTIEDYGKFAEVLLNGGSYGSQRLLAESTVEFMRRNKLTLKQLECVNRPAMKGYGYGNLFRVMIDPIAGCTVGNCGEFGWDGWSGTYFEIDPIRKLVMAYFLSVVRFDMVSFRRRIRNIVYAT